ncbi:MAG: signal peptidase I [Blastocatellia bacterium]|nr:signal peptidase I [Blastocatellia bacterium]
MENIDDEKIVARQRKGLALASLVLGIIAIPTIGLLLVGAIVGTILGMIAHKRATGDPARYGGKALAIGGIAANVFALLMSGITYFAVLYFIVQPVKVEGTAMWPTLKAGDRILVWKQIDEIERGDIVIFWFPDDPSLSFIKRVIGLPGETIRMDQSGQLYINGSPMDEPYILVNYNRFPRKIPEMYIKPHYYYVMGDNRDASNDSRSWGLVPEKYIYGKYGGTYISSD